MDIIFMEFYIKKRYNKKLQEYFNVSSPIISLWKKKHIPGIRLKEFLEKEGSLDTNILFERIYPKIS